MVDVIVGRTISDLEKYGKEGVIFIGKEYIKMENVLSLANKIYLDVNKPHLIFIAGKRGSGKSYTLSVLAEEISMLKKEYREKISVLIFDTMGIFWTMKFPNSKDLDILYEWGLKPHGIKNVRIFVPVGFKEQYSKIGYPFDFTFSISPWKLREEDWIYMLNLEPNSYVSIVFQRLIREMKKREPNFSLEELYSYVEKKELDPKIKEIILNYIDIADSWKIFEKEAHSLKFLLREGYVNILDISFYSNIGGWSLKNTIIGLISREIFMERLLYRKEEELKEIEEERSIFGEKFPLVWIIIDEAHEVLPKDKITAATDPLIQIIREGRQPGISLVLATQQPGKIIDDVLTQTDILIAHRLTNKEDIESLNKIMKNFTIEDIDRYMNRVLPRKPGSALILDDKTERILPVQIRPKMSWHGGGEPTLLK